LRDSGCAGRVAGDKNADRDPVFSPELGLAIEALREGTTVAQLWSVL
jgi:hypothetical protein